MEGRTAGRSRQRIRLDRLLVERGLAADVDEAARLLGAGQVLVNGQRDGKAGVLVRRDIRLELRPRNTFVSRAGGKLAAALDHFGLDPAGWICVDVGCSTGGFTDCLLRRGARRVYAVDVGRGVLDWHLRQDPRVVVLEKTNARYLGPEQVKNAPDFGVIDVSFISLGRVLEPLSFLFRKHVSILALVKPQFELPRHLVPRGGVVRKPELWEEAVARVISHGQGIGLKSKGVFASPVRGQRGNQEFFVWLTSG